MGIKWILLGISILYMGIKGISDVRYSEQGSPYMGIKGISDVRYSEQGSPYMGIKGIQSDSRSRDLYIWTKNGFC